MPILKQQKNILNDFLYNLKPIQPIFTSIQYIIKDDNFLPESDNFCPIFLKKRSFYFRQIIALTNSAKIAY